MENEKPEDNLYGDADVVSQTCIIKPADESRDAFAAFHFCMRAMITELMITDSYRTRKVFERFNITFTDVDGIKRVACEFPKDKSEDFEGEDGDVIVAAFQKYWTDRGGKV